MKFEVHANLQGNKLSFSDIEANCAEDAIASVKKFEPVIDGVFPQAKNTQSKSAFDIGKGETELPEGIKSLIEAMKTLGIRTEVVTVNAKDFFGKHSAKEGAAAGLFNSSVNGLHATHAWLIKKLEAVSIKDPLYSIVYDVYLEVEKAVASLRKLGGTEPTA